MQLNVYPISWYWWTLTTQMEWVHYVHIRPCIYIFCVWCYRWRMSGMQNYNPEQIVLNAVARRSSRDVNIMKEKLIFSGADLMKFTLKCSNVSAVQWKHYPGSPIANIVMWWTHLNSGIIIAVIKCFGAVRSHKYVLSPQHVLRLVGGSLNFLYAHVPWTSNISFAVNFIPIGSFITCPLRLCKCILWPLGGAKVGHLDFRHNGFYCTSALIYRVSMYY